MKNMRKLASLLLVLIMVFSLSVTASADDEPATIATTHTITIANSNDGHTYEAYQIFTGDFTVVEGAKKLSNLKWGANAKDRNAGDEVGDNIYGDNHAITADEIIALVDFGKDPVARSTFGDGKYTISGLPSGYYLIKDKDDSLNGTGETYTSYILEIVEDSTVTPKSSVPQSEKKIEDKNDSLARTSEWQDSADYDIGDTINYRLVANLAANVETYKDDYYLVFHDEMSDGLTYVSGSAVLYIDGSPIAVEQYDTKWENQKLTITLTDAKDLGAKNNSVVTVLYSATLNENAVIGAAGNPNTMYLEYANNPNWEGEGTPDTGKTPDDTVIAFTYKLSVDKVHKTGVSDDGTDILEALEGAGFTLYKKDGTTAAYLPVGEELTGDAMTNFTWTGLDDGDYKLEETTTPAGYNTIDPIFFTVTAEHDVLADDPKLTKLSGDATSGEIVFSINVDEGTLSNQIVNQQGVQLPETGGVGTTMIYVVGGIMVLAAVILLVTKKRMASAE